MFPQFQPECYYRGFRDDSGTFTPVHWKILALKFAFVIIFEHVVFGVCKLIDVVVPDIPESLDIKVKRERYLAKEALQDADHVLQKVRPLYLIFVDICTLHSLPIGNTDVDLKALCFEIHLRPKKLELPPSISSSSFLGSRLRGEHGA